MLDEALLQNIMVNGLGFELSENSRGPVLTYKCNRPPSLRILQNIEERLYSGFSPDQNYQHPPMATMQILNQRPVLPAPYYTATIPSASHPSTLPDSSHEFYQVPQPVPLSDMATSRWYPYPTYQSDGARALAMGYTGQSTTGPYYDTCRPTEAGAIAQLPTVFIPTGQLQPEQTTEGSTEQGYIPPTNHGLGTGI